MLGGGLAVLPIVLFCLYGWSQGYHVGNGLLHLVEFAPDPVAENPKLPEPAQQTVTWLADIENHDLDESSGLATSNLHEGVLWSINDSGSEPTLYALGLDGRHIGAWRVAGVESVDWESMDSFVLDGRAYLIVGDIGDNFRWRDKVSFYVIEEPESLGRESDLGVSWRVTYRYPDGPRDSESLAVDVANKEVLVLSKRHYPPELYALPLNPGTDDVVQARLIIELSDFPKPTVLDYQEQQRSARYRHTPTGMDLANGKLLITTYQHALLYDYADLQKQPMWLKLPTIGQREAITFAHNQSNAAYVTRERFERRGVADIFKIEWRDADESSQTPVAVAADGR
jgi:hypothetical protein